MCNELESQTLAVQKLDIKVEYFALIFIIIHLLCWTLAPALIRYNLPLDSVEGSLWGHQLEWGYDKNPFLNGWLTALAIYMGGTSGWMVYFFSQLSVAICLLAVWQIAKNILTPAYALVAIMLLEGVQYYHFHAIDFNDNTLELSLWAASSFFLYQALRQQKNELWSWVLTGICAGLGMMAKYYTAALLAGMLLFILSLPENRKQLLTLPPYLGLAAFLMIVTPHIVWLFSHDFITVKYMFERASAVNHWRNHIFFPAQFIWQTFEAFIPAIVLCLPLLLGKTSLAAKKQIKISAFDKAFLFYVGLGPLLLTALLSLILGINLRAGWGMPLLSLWSIILLAIIQPHLSNKKIYSFIASIFLLMAILIIAYSLSLVRSTTVSSANYPGKDIAQTITALWHDHYHRRLNFVAGSRWLGGNISLYSHDHPAVFMEWSEERSPWIKVEDVDREGAVFVWDVSNDETLPESIKASFPRLLNPTIMEFNLHRNQDKRLPPIKVGIAILPPKLNS